MTRSHRSHVSAALPDRSVRAPAGGAHDRCKLRVDTERAQDVADVGADGRDIDLERGRDLTRILACAEQLEHLALPWR